jgi:cell division protein FtsB
MRLLLAILIILILALQYRLWVGEGSFAEVSALREQVESQTIENQKLKERNAALEAEVQDLKTGYAAIEERARSELGMIRNDEMFYQIVNPEKKEP